MKMKTALIVGATGLIGGQVVQLLLNDPKVERVKVFVRHSLNINDPKLEEIKIDFNNIKDKKHLIKGHVLFCALGTTIKNAGSQQNFYNVDYGYNYSFAKAASENGVSCLVLVSSLGADSNSSNFYLKTKGQLEEAIKQLKFNSIDILQPSMLLGDRKEFRLGELIGKYLMKGLKFLFIGKLKKYRAIESLDVAKAMVLLGKEQKPGINNFESDKIFEVATNYK